MTAYFYRGISSADELRYVLTSVINLTSDTQSKYQWNM